MNIFIQEKTEDLHAEISPDVTVDCSLMTHKEILTNIAAACYLPPPMKGETILQLADRISKTIPKRRILILYSDRAPLRLAYSLMLLEAGGHVIHVHAKREIGIIRTLKANGARIHRKGFQFNYAFQLLTLLIAISLTIAIPKLLKEQGVETGILGFIVFYLLRRYLWRATWALRRK